MRSLRSLFPSSILTKLRSHLSFRQNIIPHEEQLNSSPDSSVAQQENPLLPTVPSLVTRQVDQAQHRPPTSSKALPTALFISTTSIYLLVSPLTSLVHQHLFILYAISAYVTFFVGIGLLFYTIISDETSDEVIRVQSRLMIAGLLSMIVPLLVRTSFTVQTSLLGLALIWILPLIAAGLSFRFLFAANRLLRQLPPATAEMIVAP